MKKITTLFVMSVILWSCAEKPKPEEATPSKPQPIEIWDAKYIGMGKQGLEDLAKGNVDAFIDAMAENVVYKWNNGDSIASKEKVASFWKDRRTNVIDTIAFKNDIWISVKVNEAPNVGPGVYLLGWFDASITYATGSTVKMSIHNVYHFDANDKIDFVLQYLDRAPINAALAKK